MWRNLSKQFAYLANIVIDQTCLKEINSTDESERNPYPILSFPEKLGRPMDFRWEAFVHGAIERRLLQYFPVRMIGRERDVNF